MGNHSIQRISVIVPANPFVAPELQAVHHCLTALDVENLMHWWPGTPHTPHRDAQKVTAIQRSLDWKRIAHIAAYLLQAEILDASDRISSYFAEFYGSGPLHPGRQWPPRVSRVIGYERSEFPTFSNILLHVNGASLDKGGGTSSGTQSGHLIFDENNKSLNFSVIDGQHRINGAYLAIRILQEKDGDKKWDIPAEVFLDLDPPNSPPRKQAQIFIDVNFYQKRVDRSLVSDLFPTARGERS
ncbi:MAG TPA: DNA sulfur modification protein DndB, partial [Candidatus Binatia bacterium]|nr:DNA sulfur modification protein DndB [Candidatus Binatia bacterium]